MAVRRFNSNVGDFITCAIGASTTFHEGAFTAVALVRKEADGGFFPMISAEAAANNSRRSLWTTSGDALMSNTGGSNIDTPVSFAQSDGWAVVAVTKIPGDELVRGHKGVLGGAWSHADGNQGFDDTPGTQTLTNIKIGSWQDNAHWHGLGAALALWSGTALADAALEDGFRSSAAAWLDSNPTGMWLLNQTSTGIAVVDVTGGGADQTAIDGTTVVDGDDPPGFDFSLSTATVIIDLGGAARGAGRPAALAVGPALLDVPDGARAGGPLPSLTTGTAIADVAAGASAAGRLETLQAGAALAGFSGAARASGREAALSTGPAVHDVPGAARAGGRPATIATGNTIAEPPGGARAGGRTPTVFAGTTVIDTAGTARAATRIAAVHVGSSVADRPVGAEAAGLPARIVTTAVTQVPGGPPGQARAGGRPPAVVTAGGGVGVVVCVPPQPRIVTVPATCRVITVDPTNRTIAVPGQ